MNNITRSIQTIFLRFSTLSIICLLLVTALYIDVVVLQNGLSETSVTEVLQETILLIVVCLFLSMARRNPAHRGFLVLAAGFFATMLIRELDQLFDLITHGFWFYPAMAIALAAIGYAGKHLSSTACGLDHFVKHKQFIAVCNALVIILIFSRLFGTGELWHHVLDDGYVRVVKNMIEEGTELLGYEFLLVGVLGYYRAFKKSLSRETDATTHSDLAARSAMLVPGTPQ